MVMVVVSLQGLLPGTLLGSLSGATHSHEFFHFGQQELGHWVQGEDS